VGLFLGFGVELFGWVVVVVVVPAEEVVAVYLPAEVDIVVVLVEVDVVVAAFAEVNVVFQGGFEIPG